MVGVGFTTDYVEGGDCVRIASHFDPNAADSGIGVSDIVIPLSFIGEGEAGGGSSALGFSLEDPDSSNLDHIRIEVTLGSSVDINSDIVRARCSEVNDSCSQEVCDELNITTGYTAGGILVYEFRYGLQSL